MNPVDKSASLSQPEFSWVFNRKIALFTLLVLPILCGLGFWQLDRAAEKRELQANYVQQQAQPPATLTTDNIEDLPDYHRVLVPGTFDNDHTWLLDNKQREGRVGYEIVSTFVLEDGSQILVNRGWLAGGNRRADLPEITPVNGRVTLFAELASIHVHPLLDAQNNTQSWPKIIMALDRKTMEQQLGEPLLPRYLRLDESSPGALFTGWQPINISADKHLGYAVQWFAMALAMAIWFIFINTNVLVYWRSRRTSNKNTQQNN